MMDSDKVAEARMLALKLIGQYLRTELEIRRKLDKKGYSDSVQDDTIRELIEEEYINDREYAFEWLRNKLVVKPGGRMLYSKKLRERGVAPEIIEEVLDSKYSHEQEQVFADNMAQKKYNELVKFGKKNVKQKTTFYLKNKGFGSDIIYKALDKL